MLDALGLAPERFHLNEGHAALAVPMLLLRGLGSPSKRGALAAALRRVRAACVFTTHTPVPAGHDRFGAKLVRRVLDRDLVRAVRALCKGSELNMTHLAAAGSGFTNGVSARHTQVSRRLLPECELHTIPNGVHPGTWVAPSMAALFDHHVPGWRRDPLRLRDVTLVPAAELWNAHARAKRALVRHVARTSGVRLDPEGLTLGFARRATGYKRASLLLRQPRRLRALARALGPVQIVYAGKAHPRDEPGKALIREVHELRARLAPDVLLVYLAGYDMAQAALLVAGCDVWVNTPLAPLEASGTSGMKAALNGVPSLSVLDGWWLEGCVDGVTGWAVGARDDARLSPAHQDERHGEAVLARLERDVAPRFFKDRPGWIETMRATIALNGSYFTSHRMLEQYARFAWEQA
jgi:starch phosphorylase